MPSVVQAEAGADASAGRTFFTVDTHFGDHRTTSIQRRPFANAAEMDDRRKAGGALPLSLPILERAAPWRHQPARPQPRAPEADPHQFDIGFDARGFSPVTLEELVGPARRPHAKRTP